MDLQSDTQSTLTDGTSIAFEAGKKVGDISADTYISHDIYYPSTLNEGDIFITEVPTYLALKADNQSPNCDATYFEYCLIFFDIRWIVWKVKAGASISSRISSDIVLTNTPSSIFQETTYFNSYLQ